MRTLKKTIFFIIFVSFASAVHSQDIKTNLDVLKELYTRALQDIRFSPDDSLNEIALVNLKPAESDAWLVEDALIDYFEKIAIEKVYSRTLDDKADTTQVWKLYYRPVQNSVSYQQKKNQLFRRISIAVYFKGLTADSRVLFSENVEKSYSDTLQLNDLKYIENKSLPVTVGEKPAGFWEKVVEPALISVVTAAVIIVFYSYRSK